ncbi:MAG: MBL fold metallo-hydrolase [Chloroflexi bacterium]|nr:MBL fold metallo-hydrolase [Chloroflexota bacterium]MDL1884418.1 MBL fold metallo-hydrolase [Anaerolineae bacterium CFX8]
MRLTFYGAAQTVTGSQHMIEVNGKRILLDCGLYQGKRAESQERNRRLPFDPQSVDVMILSHAHIDHSGNIPNLVKNGFGGDIICTHATRDLCAVMLLDSGHIQERDVEYVNKKNRKRGKPPVEPVYTQADAEASLDSFVSQNYSRQRQVLPGVYLTFLDAGHMLGSAIVILDIEDREAHRDVRLVFSGDLGRVGIPIIRDPQMVDSADLLIMESTYGDRLHPPYPDAERELERIVVETYQRGGKVIVPAFAVGRTQQLVYTLHQLANRGDIPRLPIYVDSPLAVNTTDVFRTHPECFDAETRQFILDLGGQADPFGFQDVTYTRLVEESKRLNFLRQPAIIISASGMAETGRILHHLKNNIENPNNTVLIAGWQAPDTLGRRLVERQPEVRIFGETYTRRAQVEVLDGFSGHADRDELLAWAGAFRRRPQQTFLVHGEPEAADALAGGLKERYGMAVFVPEWKQSFEV